MYIYSDWLMESFRLGRITVIDPTSLHIVIPVTDIISPHMEFHCFYERLESRRGAKWAVVFWTSSAVHLKHRADRPRSCRETPANAPVSIKYVQQFAVLDIP